MTLSRTYQNEALACIIADLAAGINSLLLVLATGLGKTVVASNTPRSVLNMQPGQQLFFLVHRDELVFQAAKSFAKYNPNLKVGIEKAELRADQDCDIIIASVQTIGPAGKNGATYSDRLKQFNPSRVACVICDEVHHALGENYLRIFRWFRVMKGDDGRNPNVLLLGITATPNRSDSVGLEAILDKITFDYGIEKGCQDGAIIDGHLYPYLARPRGHRVNTDVSLKDVRITAGELNVGDLGKVIDTPERNALMVDKYLELGNGKPFMCFTNDIAHSHNMAAAFLRKGISCYPVSGKTPKEERRKFIRLYNEGAALGLASCDALSEGSDLPRAKVALMGRPWKSPLKYIQQVGRVLRPYPSPEDFIEMMRNGSGVWEMDTAMFRNPRGIWESVDSEAIVIDFCDSSARHSLVTIPTLFGLRPEFDLKGESAPAVAKKVADLQKKQLGLDLKQYNSLEEIQSAVLHVDLFRPPTVSQEVKKHSKYSWLELAEGVWSLNVPSTGSSLQIRTNALGRFEIAHTRNGVRAVQNTVESMANAFTMADEMIPKGDSVLLKTDAKWHGQEPTLNQCQKLFYIDRDIKRRYKSAKDFFDEAVKLHGAGNSSYSRGGISRMIDSKSHARGGGI